MIATFRPPTPATRVAGSLCLAVAVWATFTSAAPRSIAQRGEPTSRTSQRRTVRVERQSAAPAWKAQLEAALSTEFEASFQDVEFDEIVQWLRTTTGLNVVVDPDLAILHDGTTVHHQPGRMTVAAFLDRLTQVVDGLGWCMTNEAVYIGERGCLPEPLELRIYQVAPLLESARAGVASPEDLMELVLSYAEPAQETWDLEGRSIDYWNGLLVIAQTEALHRDIEELLNRLLNRGERAGGADLAPRAAVEAKLSEPTEIHAEGMAVSELAQLLSARHGLYIHVAEDYRDQEVTLTLGAAQLGSALRWIASALGTRVVIEEEMVRLADEWPEPTLEFYDLAGLFERSTTIADDEVKDTLMDMLRSHLDPESWDECPAHMISFWGDQMLVMQQPDVQAQIDGLIEAVQRALEAGR